MSNNVMDRNGVLNNSSSTAPKIEEDLSSQIDGSNLDFTISTSFNASSIDVYYNGIKQRTPNEFTVTSDDSIQTTFTPSQQSVLTVAYYKS